MYYDGMDRFYREAIGIALRGRESEAWNAIVEKAGTEWDLRLGGLAVQLHPVEAFDLAAKSADDEDLFLDLRTLALQALDAIGTPEAGAHIAKYAASDSELRTYAMELLARDGGNAWRAAVDASNLDAALRARLQSPVLRESALGFIREARRGAFVPDLLAMAADASLPIDERVGAVQTAGGMARRDNTPAEALNALIASDQGRIAAEALTILARFRDEAALDQLYAYVLDEAHPLGLRRTALRGLAESKPGALALLKAAEAGDLPADIEFDAGEALRASRYDDVRMLAGQALPPEQTRDGKPLPTSAELAKMTGDAQRGRAIFFSEERSQCYRCHVIGGEGKLVGPDLSKIGEKFGADGLLESILNPSAAISHEYVVWVVETNKDVYTGYLRKDSPEGVELVDSNGNAVAIPTGEITDRYKSALSLMPSGLAAGMTAQELVDVVAFLTAQK